MISEDGEIIGAIPPERTGVGDLVIFRKENHLPEDEGILFEIKNLSPDEAVVIGESGKEYNLETKRLCMIY
jgi:hypothetical protein